MQSVSPTVPSYVLRFPAPALDDHATDKQDPCSNSSSNNSKSQPANSLPPIPIVCFFFLSFDRLPAPHPLPSSLYGRFPPHRGSCILEANCMDLGAAAAAAGGGHKKAALTFRSFRLSGQLCQVFFLT